MKSQQITPRKNSHFVSANTDVMMIKEIKKNPSAFKKYSRGCSVQGKRRDRVAKRSINTSQNKCSFIETKVPSEMFDRNSNMTTHANSTHQNLKFRNKRRNKIQYQVPENMKYRFITPKHYDKGFNRNAFNTRYNELMSNYKSKQNEFQVKGDEIMKKLNNKFKKVESNLKQLQKNSTNEVYKTSAKTRSCKAQKIAISKDNSKMSMTNLINSDIEHMNVFYQHKLENEMHKMTEASKQHKTSCIHLNNSKLNLTTDDFHKCQRDHCISKDGIEDINILMNRTNEFSKTLQKVKSTNNKFSSRVNKSMADSITERAQFEELFLVKQSAVEKKKLYQRRIKDAHNKIREGVKYKRY